MSNWDTQRINRLPIKYLRTRIEVINVFLELVPLSIVTLKYNGTHYELHVTCFPKINFELSIKVYRILTITNEAIELVEECKYATIWRGYDELELKVIIISRTSH